MTLGVDIALGFVFTNHSRINQEERCVDSRLKWRIITKARRSPTFEDKTSKQSFGGISYSLIESAKMVVTRCSRYMR